MLEHCTISSLPFYFSLHWIYKDKRWAWSLRAPFFIDFNLFSCLLGHVVAQFLHKVYYLCFTRDTSLCFGSTTSVEQWNYRWQRVLVSVQYTSQGKHECRPGRIHTLHMDKLWVKKMGCWQRKGIHGLCQRRDYPWGEWSTCLAWTPSTNVKGRQWLPIVRGYRSLLIGWSYVRPLLRTRVSFLTSPMSLSLSITCPSQCHRAGLHPTTLTSAKFLSLPTIVYYNSCIRV